MNIKSILIIIFLTWCASFTSLISQIDSIPSIDTLHNYTDTSFYTNNDSLTLIHHTDSVMHDSIFAKKKKDEPFLDAKVEYKAKDSIIFSMKQRVIYLYGEAEINYVDINLKAQHIKFDMANQEVHAKGALDSTGATIGNPVFKQGAEEFESTYLKYNFDTKKGYIQQIITEQEGGYLHGSETKRLPNGNINIKKGKFTTCDHPHPHFYLGISKGIVIPEDKIVSGPAYIVMHDIPMPIILPFGWFPNTRGASSGIIVPSYGEENERGLYLANGGYYIPINEHADLKIMGDVYAKGTWGISMASQYKYRYRFSGNLSGRYYENVYGEKGIDQSKRKDFSVMWNHRQDPKAHPTRTFSANVNFSSTSFDDNHSKSISDRLTNTKTSSINYSKTFAGTPFNLSMSMNHSQNKQTEMVNLSLPSMQLSMNRIYPFRSKNAAGEMKWYENIQLSYSSRIDNEIQTKDTLLFTHTTFKDWEKGYTHNIPVSVNFKFLKYFNFSPQVSYKGMLYDYKSDIIYNSLGETQDEKYDTVKTYGLYYAQAFSPSASVSVNPKIYGMYQFKRSRIQAIRHLVSPSASFSYVPDVAGINPDYNRFIIDRTTGDTARSASGVLQEYSIYRFNKYGAPSLGKRSGSLSLSLRNNLEMKLFRSDTADKPEKIKLLDNFDLSTSYNPFAEEFKWNNIRLTSKASLLKNKLSIQYTGNIDPYTIDTIDGRWTRIDKYELNENSRLGRWTSSSISASLNLRSGAGGDNQDDETLTDDVLTNPNTVDEFGNVIQDQFGNSAVDFNVPWSLRVNYSWTRSKPFDEVNIVQTFSASGDLSLTKNWKISYRTGYDFNSKKFTQTSLNIHRDLHCWTMSLNLVPFGTFKSYQFQINVKSGMLQDLKWDRNKNWRDNQ